MRKGANVNVQDATHEIPLFHAAEKGYKAIVQTLLKHGANIEAQDMIGWTPLHIAAQNGHLHVVNVLLDSIKSREQFIKLNADDGKVAIPLQLAARSHHTDIISVLLIEGASFCVHAILLPSVQKAVPHEAQQEPF